MYSVILTTRYGDSLRDPTAEQIAAASQELLAIADPEHANAWMELFSASGRMYNVDAYESGLVIYSEYADHDYEELMSELRFRASDAGLVTRLWTIMAAHDLDALLAEVGRLRGIRDSY
ncbi:MAG: hypothetical protein H7A21_14030 [Spirochaetales bacterium]|nr:hypothetical protein [Leptospiraceae bacterium]MCP5482551.1 hypothetical protein [Spirochaetales bacterium]MCP5485141.1 hypothetical protein [Spirochaetales bacterium]